MYYIAKTPNESGAYPPPQDRPAEGLIPLTDDQRDVVLQYNGFVTISSDKDDHGATTYKVTPNLEAWEAWKAEQENPSPPEEPLTWETLASAIREGVNAV